MKRIEDWEDYSVTEDGRIWSHRSNKFLKCFSSKEGYIRLELNKDGLAKNLTVHRLVAQAFIPNPEGKSEVNHIDGNKSNNHVSNLEWVTRSENMVHAIKNNLQTINKGIKNPNAKLTEEQVEFIRANYKFRDPKYSFKAMAKEFNVSDATVTNAYYGKVWSHI